MLALCIILGFWLTMGLKLQYDSSIRTGQVAFVESDTGTSPIMRLYNGTPPATVNTALSGNTLLAEGTLPSDWATESSGVLSKSGTWTLTGQSGAGVGTIATFFRIYKADGTTPKIQGTVTSQIVIVTSALTAVNGNVLTFTSTTGVAVGMYVTGTGIVTGTQVVAVTSTTVTLSLSSTAGVAITTTITFGGDITADNPSIANAQSVTVSAFTITAQNG